MREVKKERCGWRDERLSAWHRSLGWDCPCVDIDFLVVEYDIGVPKALIEYKHVNADKQDPKHPSYKALKILADRARLPFFCCRYENTFKIFFVVPLNDIAKKILPNRTEMVEVDYVAFLYRLRGRIKPDHLSKSSG